MFEPTEEMKAAYRWTLDVDIFPLSFVKRLADLAQHATAAALALQFSIDHDFHAADECKNPYHKYTAADWLRLADEKLRK